MQMLGMKYGDYVQSLYRILFENKGMNKDTPLLSIAFYLAIKFKNSSRVLESSLNVPNIIDEIVDEFCF